MEALPAAHAPSLSAVMPAAVALYGILTLLGLERWPSGLMALVVAALLWRRHPRARFATYVLFSVLGARAVVAGDWPMLALGVSVVVVMQTPAAARVWPRLRPGATRAPSDRMARP